MTFHERRAPFDLSDAGGEVLSLFSSAPRRSTRQHEPRAANLVLVGTFAPRKCGIATFTTDIWEQLGRYHPEIATEVYALDQPGLPVSYANVTATIACDDPAAYAAAAEQINAAAPDAVWLQHEYGIFGGPDGDMVCDFVDRLAPPLVLTLHTVLSEPTDRQRAIVAHLISRASRIMVMSHHSRSLLLANYTVAPDAVEVIEHGAPDRPFGRQALFRSALGLENRKILMTFGLLGPGKGIERVIEALPAIVERHPDVLYRIVGATHPVLAARDGEAYRDRLKGLADRLGVADHIAWENRFLDTEDLLDQLEASDIYITPYLNLQQSTSGTLSYAVALGKAVVSTPYVHARELLADDVGVLIEPGCSAAIAEAVNALLDCPERLLTIQRSAYAKGRETIWPRFAEAAARLVMSAVRPHQEPVARAGPPEIGGVLAMCDATGMLQHSIGIVPDRAHGYCLDDTVRALMLFNRAAGLAPAQRSDRALVCASFLQHAWNPDAGRFRNFMRFDRSWCEDIGSEDSNGRALWVLGDTIATSPDADLADWARAWFDRVVEPLSALESPRTRAFCLLGACARLRADPWHRVSRELVERGRDMLMSLLHSGRRPGWTWFEVVLAYDNPRLPQALIEAGMALGDSEATSAGLEALDWISQRQLSPAGHFRPVGSESFGRPYESRPFDQQPLEAQAAIEAAHSALKASGDLRWMDRARIVWDWFFGANDRGVVLADMATGRCRDGITPRGANLNCGAESILAFHLSWYALRSMRTVIPPAVAGDALAYETKHYV